VSNTFVLVLVVITALGFDFTNGFHDTANAMATSIATKALSPRVAVGISGVLNLVGAFLSLAVAATIASGLVDTKLVTLTVVAAGLAGGITWNLVTWLFGIPSSSSHALIGGVIGATIAASGGHAVLWHGLVSKVVLPALFSPIIAALVAATGTYLLYRISRSLTEAARGRQVGRTPAADGEAQEDRAVPVTQLFVAEAEPRGDQQVVDGSLGARVPGRPGPHGAVDESGVPLAQRGIREAEGLGSGGTEAMDQNVGSGQEPVELTTPLFGGEIEDDAALGPVPGEEGRDPAGGIAAGSFHLDHVSARIGQQF